MDSIMGNNTWVLTDLPPGCRPLGCKWIFKRKMKVDGTVKKFKARLVIHGFKQKSRIDYFDTYALVARISTIRLMIAMALIHNLIIHQMDVKTAFLNRELEEEVYMNQPLGFIMPGNENKVDLTKEFLSSRFSMKDMEEADVIPVSTPLDTCEKLMPNKGQAISQLEYFRVIGCLMYAMTCTRSDIAFIVRKLSRYTSNPGTQHWQAIQRVLKYLKKTMDYRLIGWVFLLGGGVISWASITGSTMESKFVALAATGKEGEWLKNLLLEIPLWVKPIAPISVRCDSATTLAKAYSQMYNGKSRHLGVRHSMIRELITNRVISIEFVRSQQNLVDHLTRGLARDLVIKSVKGI
ncbi:zinc finger, CCHC-type containing protein [Tanacetum coccineum]